MKILPIFAIFSILIVAGCTSSLMPSVAIVLPTEGQTISGSTVTVTLGASNVRLAAPDGTVVEGEGHFHVWVDETEQRGPQTTFTFDAAPGTHTIKVELHKGDHSLYEGTAKTSTFTAVAPGTLPPVSTLPSPQAPVKEFNMTAFRFAFDPSTITVNKGDRVMLHITSADVEHGFSLATYNIVETLPAGETRTITFTADQAGEFNFFCSVFCGSGHADMRGKLIVTNDIGYI